MFSKIDELNSYLDSLHACLFWSVLVITLDMISYSFGYPLSIRDKKGGVGMGIVG